VVARRERAGDAAKYDRRRLERERAVAEVRAEAERAACEGARGRLHALIGEDSGAVVASGALLPEAAPSALPTLRASIDARPDVRALDWRAAAAALDRKAASRWWAPDVRLEAGWKGVDLGRGNRTDGFLVGVTLSVPAWDRSAGVARAAEGEARAAQGRRALLVAEARDGLGGARAEALRLRAAAETMRSKAGAASADLVRIATAGYEGGELGLLELLDAYRGAADDSVAALDLELAARRARIELDRVTGSETP
jgi:cobalt-zinc-cadmium efflux system outer membrane protein